MSPPPVSVDEVQMLLGEQLILIYALRKQIAELQKNLAEVTPKTELRAVE